MKMKQIIFLSIVFSMTSFGNFVSAKNNCDPEKLNVSCWDCGSNCTADLVDNELIVTGSGTLNGSGWSLSKWGTPEIRNQIQKITIGEGITEIATAAFYKIPAIEVNFPSTLTTIQGSAFHSSRVTNVVIPDSVTNLGAHALYGGVGSVYCPSHLNCTQNQTPSGVIVYEKNKDSTYQINGKTYQQIGNFNDLCESGHKCFMCNSTNVGCWADFNEETGELTFTGNGTIQGSWSKEKWRSDDILPFITKVTVEEGITGIGAASFWGAGNLESVDLPSTLLSIGQEAFETTGLKEINLPDSLQTIGVGAFNGTYGLDNVIVPISVTSVGGYGFNIRGTVYCPEGMNCNVSGISIPYSKIGSYYSANGKTYRDAEHMLKGIEMKRIYTVSEAEKALGKENKNTFSVRYR